MNDQQQAELNGLQEFVTFLPASYDKRFCRSLVSEMELTEKQDKLLANMYHRYRRQIPNHAKICRICSGQVEHYKRVNVEQQWLDKEKLEQWKQAVQPPETDSDTQMELGL